MQLIVAIIGAAHGLKGEVKLDVRTDAPDQRFAIGTSIETDPAAAGPLTVANRRAYKGGTYVRFAEVKDRTTAESLRGVALVIESDDLEESEADRAGSDSEGWYPHELRGLVAIAPSGEELGVIADLQLAPAQDLLVVREATGRLVLVPFVQEIVPEVNLEAQYVVIAAPPGLFSEAELEVSAESAA